MFATTQHPPLMPSLFFRWAGRLCGATLFVIWAAFVALEATRPTADAWPTGLYLQAAALTVVFLGYAIGWKRELVGALLVGIGALAYFVITFADTQMLPGPAIVWFLIPGVLYLIAFHYERAEQQHGQRLVDPA